MHLKIQAQAKTKQMPQHVIEKDYALNYILVGMRNINLGINLYLQAAFAFHSLSVPPSDPLFNHNEQ